MVINTLFIVDSEAIKRRKQKIFDKNNKWKIQKEKNTYTGYKTKYCSKINEPENKNVCTKACMPLPRFGKMVP